MLGGKASFNQTISLPLNMYFDSTKGTFQDKKVDFILIRLYSHLT
jgi:hypothetical protein